MKTNTTIRPTPTRQSEHHRRLRPAQTESRPDHAGPRPAGERRLYTDFLALALYPGMTEHDHDSAA